MRKNRIIIIVIVCACAIIAGLLFKYYLYTESIEGKVKANCKSYKNCWKLDYIDLNENNSEINVVFSLYKYQLWDKNFVSESSSIYREITDYLFSDDFEYCKFGYHLNFNFLISHNDFHVEDIYPGMEGLSVRFSTYDVEVKDVAQCYPEAEKLTITGDFKVEDLAEFKNLQCLKINDGITQEEKEQILSVFPDIDLGNTKIKDE